jgi:hypothetical protein
MCFALRRRLSSRAMRRLLLACPLTRGWDAAGAGGRSVRLLDLDDFELWRPRVAWWALVTAALDVGYWVLWLADRGVVASGQTAEYVSFEQAFPLADAWLLAALLATAAQLFRRRPSAIVWVFVVGGAGLYLAALDILFDLQHGIYGNPHGGAVELGINLVTAASSAGILTFGWRFRHALLGLSPHA